MLLSSGRWDLAFVNTVWVDKVPGGKVDSLAIDMVLGGKADSVATASSEVVERLGRVPEKSELILPRESV